MKRTTEQEQALVRMGKGRAAAIQHVQCSSWLGAQKPSIPPFDAAQAAENRKLYPHLFGGGA